jgi:hypothetical protein
MSKKQNVKGLAILSELANMLNVNLKDSGLAIATDRKSAKVSFSDGSLEATLFSSLNGPTVKIDSPRNPGIWIEMVDHTRYSDAPKGAIYRIISYMPEREGRDISLDGDIFSIYVGREGLILSESAKERVTRFLKK